MVFLGEGFEITSAGIRKIENYGRNPEENDSDVLFTHYEEEIPFIGESFKINEPLQNGFSASTKTGIEMESSASSIDMNVFEAFDIAGKTSLHRQLEITQARIKELKEKFSNDELVRISSIASLECMEERLKKEIVKRQKQTSPQGRR